MVNSNTKRRTATRIAPAIEARIIELSMQHPEFGARRLLPLLRTECIAVSVSSIYNIMKRHGLQNRGKRFARIQAQQAIEALPPQPGLSMDAKRAPFHRGRSAFKAAAKIKTRRSWRLKSIDALLLAMLAFSGFHTVSKIRRAMQEPQLSATAIPAPVNFAAGTTKVGVATPLAGYSTIWKRNLFGAGRSGEVDSDKITSLKKIIPTQKDLNLELVGTVVADNPNLSRAIIDDRRIGRQLAYREGDTAGMLRIKKILRNSVVVATDGGDRLLLLKTATIRESGRRLKPFPDAPPYSADVMPPPDISDGRPRGYNPWSFKLRFEELEASLADTQRLMQEATLDPFMQGNSPVGFAIADLKPDAIYKKIGLQNGDVISGVNGEAVTGPDQAAHFFQRIAEGGVVEIKIKRRRRTRYISLNIE